VLDELGVKQVFHKIALRPGKPLWFGVKDEQERRTLVFALPGNPVSSLVCFELFVRPAIEILSGRRFSKWSTFSAKLSGGFAFSGGRAACLPALITGSMGGEVPTATILPWHGSADIFSLTKANGLAHFRGDARSLEAGALVNVISF
jgi:molybdopterin molybdotransferase